MSDNRPTVYFDEEVDAWIYRASGVGNCVRALVASALDYDPARSADTHSMLERTAEEGNIHEAAMRAVLIEEGHVFEDEEGEQIEVMVPVVKNKVYIRGHIDGRILEGPRIERPSLWEAKSLSTNAFKEWMAKGKDRQPKRFKVNEKKAAQISTYMRAYPEDDVLYQSKRRDDGTVDSFIIPAGQPPMPFAKIRKKILTAETYRRQGFLPPCDVENKFGCDFWYLHEEEVLEDDNVDEETDQALVILAEEHLRLRAIENAGDEAGKERKSKVTPELLELMGNHKTREVGGFKISVVSFDKQQVDWSAVETELTGMNWEVIDVPIGNVVSSVIAKNTKIVQITYPKVTKK